MPIKLTQKVSSIFGVSSDGNIGNDFSFALSLNKSIELFTQVATTGFSTNVSVVITYKGLIVLFSDLSFSNTRHINCKQALLSFPPE